MHPSEIIIADMGFLVNRFAAMVERAPDTKKRATPLYKAGAEHLRQASSAHEVVCSLVRSGRSPVV